MSPLVTTYLNRHVELLDAVYGSERWAQYQSLPRLYNLLIGPLTSVNLYRPGLLDLPMYGSSAKHVAVGSLMRDLATKNSQVLDTLEIPCGGKGLTMQSAFLGTLGEVAERLLAVLHWGGSLEEFEFASYDKLVRQGRAALGPEDIMLFAEEQYSDPNFEYTRFRSDTPLTWVQGTDLLTGDPVMVPAQLAIFYWKRRRGEARIGYATTGGLAFHPSRRQAILHGIYENVERDAVNLRWYCKLPPPIVAVDLAEFLHGDLGLRRSRVTTPFMSPVEVFLNTVDLPLPVFTVVAFDRSRHAHAFLAGGGGWGTKERALLQALGEIGQMRAGFRLARDAWAHIRPDSSLSELSDFFYAPVYYGYAENLPRLAWYTSGSDKVAWEAVPSMPELDEDEQYSSVMELLRAAGIRPILLEFPASGSSDMWVTKVYMPQLTQAHIPSHPCLGHPRYYEVPQRIGLSDRRLGFEDINPDPLPFP
jgi:ribosomal protein S12 methylthiotransferase accessory factor